MTKTRQERTSINIEGAIADTIDSRRRGKESRVARLEADLSAYHALLEAGLRRARRTLSPAEAALILDVFNGTPPGQAWPADRLADRIEDAITLDGMADKWGVNGGDLVFRLRDIGDIAAVALADWAEGVWGKGDFDVAAETGIFKGA